MSEDLQPFVDDLIVEQKKLDAHDKLVGAEIVAQQNLKTLDEAKQFAAAWIGTASQGLRNTEYMTGERDKWKNRSEENEARLEMEKLAHDETRGYRQHAENQLKDLRLELAAILVDIDDAMRDVDPEVSWQSAGTRDKLVKLAEGK
jgi:hypothetical protein